MGDDTVVGLASTAGSKFLSHPLGAGAFSSLKQIADGLPADAWRDYGTGVRLGRVARNGDTQFVFYDIADGASADAFQEHMHPGGELYLVVEGLIFDEYGEFGPGNVIWMKPGSTHTPQARGKTLIFVVWPMGVKLTKRA